MKLFGACTGEGSRQGGGPWDTHDEPPPRCQPFSRRWWSGWSYPTWRGPIPQRRSPIPRRPRRRGSRGALRHLHGPLAGGPRGVAGDLPVHRRQHLLRWPQPRLCPAQPDDRVGSQCLGCRLVAGPDLLRRPAVLRVRDQAQPVRGQRRGGAWECGRDRRRGHRAQPGAPSRQRPLRRRRALRPDQRLLCRRGADLRLRVDPGPAPERVPRRRLRPSGLRSSRPGGELLLHLVGATGRRLDGALGQRRHADRLAHRRRTPSGPSGSVPSSTAATTSRPGAGCRSTSTATSSRDLLPRSPRRTASRAPRLSTCAPDRAPPPRSAASSRRAAPLP